MKLIITRHGETEENVKKIFQGHLHGRLTNLGKEQGKKLAERLKDEKINVIFSSDLARAADTAKEIAKFHPEIPIYFVKELRERFLGNVQGKAQKEIGWDKNGNRDLIMIESQAEKIPVMTKRARDFKEKLIKEFPGKNVLLIGHRAINTAIASDILKKDWLEFFNETKPKNTSVTIFEFKEDKKPELKLMNCVKHLED